jgi:catechol 2,3-dioxygenase-like lactoylglutathione lyase family enzyme
VIRAIFHLNAASLAAHRRFWVDTLGGAGVSPHLIVIPGAEFRVAERKPTGGTRGTAVNHIAFAVPDIRRAVDAARAAGYAIVTRTELPHRIEVKDDLAYIPLLNTSVAFAIGPDEAKVEFLEVPAAPDPIAFHHIHFFSPEPEKLKLWYARLFGVHPADRGPFQAIDLPNGFNLTFSPSEPVQPTAGRVVDRIGFEVDDVSGFIERTLTDPWGTSIEITAATRSPR